MRIFIAIEISDKKILDTIKELQDRMQIQAKAVKLENIHFTLQFIGEVNAEMVKKIKSELKKKIVFSTFMIQIRGIGTFPNPRAPKVIWAGTDEKGRIMLKELAEKINSVFLTLGFKQQQNKPFRPHLTIFRVKNKIVDITKVLDEYKDQELGVMQVSKIKLKESRLTPDGPIYFDVEVINAN